MKKFMLIPVIALGLCLSGCGGCGADEETPEQIKIEDSIAEADRNESVDNADRMLREADSLEKLRQDSLEKAGKK